MGDILRDPEQKTSSPGKKYHYFVFFFSHTSGETKPTALDLGEYIKVSLSIGMANDVLVLTQPLVSAEGIREVERYLSLSYGSKVTLSSFQLLRTTE